MLLNKNLEKIEASIFKEVSWTNLNNILKLNLNYAVKGYFII